MQLQDGQTVMGTGTVVVQSASGTTASWTAPAVGATLTSPLFTNALAPAVSMANNSTLAGVTINMNGLGDVQGVVATNVTGATISGNTISVSTLSGLASAVVLNNSTATVINNSLSTLSDGMLDVGTAALQINAGTSTVSRNWFFANVSVTGGTVNSGLGVNWTISGTCYATGAITGTILLGEGATCP